MKNPLPTKEQETLKQVRLPNKLIELVEQSCDRRGITFKEMVMWGLHEFLIREQEESGQVRGKSKSG